MAATALPYFLSIKKKFESTNTQSTVTALHCHLPCCPACQLPLQPPHLATQPGQPSHSDDELAPVCLGMADVCPQATKLATAPLLIYCDGLRNNPRLLQFIVTSHRPQLDSRIPHIAFHLPSSSHLHRLAPVRFSTQAPQPCFERRRSVLLTMLSVSRVTTEHVTSRHVNANPFPSQGDRREPHLRGLGCHHGGVRQGHR